MHPRARIVARFALLALVSAAGCGYPPPPTDVARLIQQAGDTEDDTVRLDILRRLQADPSLAPRMRKDVDALVRIVEIWLDRKWLWNLVEFSEDHPDEFWIDRGSPLHPVFCLYRGRVLVWKTIEGADPGDRRRWLAQAVEDFRTAQAAFPTNRIMRMYLGEPKPWKRDWEGVEEAPEWARLQREALERLTEIIHWWIDHRLREDGFYGGGSGDDCEMWRWWAPALIGFEDAKIIMAQRKLSEAVMNMPTMQGGYTGNVTDVAHSSEPTADTITPMLLLDPNNLIWQARALRLAERMACVWTGHNERGLLQFKSAFFSFETVDLTPRRACDTLIHPRVVQPTLIVWLRTRDERLTELFTAWMDTWVAAAASTERGKPAGVLPPTIHWPDGLPGGEGEEWWNPRCSSSARAFRWPGHITVMLDTLLLTYHMTGDERYLSPLRSMAAIRWQWLNHPGSEPPLPGSEAWCAERLNLLVPACAKYQALTGNREFEALLAREGYPGRTGDPTARDATVSALRDTVEALRVNFEGYTSEVRYTDRVVRFPRLFTDGMMSLPGGASSIKQPNPQLLYTLVTGDLGSPRYFPCAAARWLTPPRDLAVMVTESGRDHITAELFHFGPNPRPMAAELRLLEPGNYDVMMESNEGQLTEGTRSFSIRTSTARIDFELPPRKLCVLRVAKSNQN